MTRYHVVTIQTSKGLVSLSALRETRRIIRLVDVAKQLPVWDRLPELEAAGIVEPRTSNADTYAHTDFYLRSIPSC